MNKNMIIFGETGTGLSFLLKDQILREINEDRFNKQIIVITRNGFMEEFCTAYDGEYIKIKDTDFQFNKKTKNGLVVFDIMNFNLNKDNKDKELEIGFQILSWLERILVIDKLSNLEIKKERIIFIDDFQDLVVTRKFARLNRWLRSYKASSVVTCNNYYVAFLKENFHMVCANSSQILILKGYSIEKLKILLNKMLYFEEDRRKYLKEYLELKNFKYIKMINEKIKTPV